MTVYENLNRLKGRPEYCARRIYAELLTAFNYNEAFNCGYDTLLEETAQRMADLAAPTMADVRDLESALAELSPKIKSLRVLAIAHAHIDMNWMWSFNETVSVTLSTFRTVLDLMEEFPGFTFGQSQASVYRIVEKYDPDMLEEIRQRVKEGRWEPVVGAWTETDMNMPAGETLCRHILYAKQYMARLLDIDPERLNLQFLPDTFGHNANVPRIMNAGGIKYYYHCRGYEGHNIYRWRCGESELLNYREPVWYNADLSFEDCSYMPKFARDNNITTLLKVYGVGDHGGGPTRRDLSTLTDMMTWPLMPDIRFGTYGEFYAYLDSIREQFPVVTGELNAFATGCYTTQTRIKRYNKICENQLYEAEAYDALNRMTGGKPNRGAGFPEAWEHVLFNDFHDILPGSGTVDTREHALGRFQECLAITSSRGSKALTKLAEKIDTSAYNFSTDGESRSAGAGVGYNHVAGVYGRPDRNNSGVNRIYHLFNSTQYDCTVPSVITVWDYPGDLRDVRLQVLGKRVGCQLLDPNPVFYWGHLYQRLAVDAFVPALGYTTVVLQPETQGHIAYPFPTEPRLDGEYGFVLENDLLRVELDTASCAIRSLVDKRTGKAVIDDRSGYFRLIREDASREMTAWMVGRYSAVRDLTENVTVKPWEYIKGELIQSVTYTVDFSDSHLRVTLSLEKNSPCLKYSCTCDFGEKPVLHECVPQLNAWFPCKVEGESYMADIPFGKLRRPLKDMDMPSINGVMVDTPGGKLYVMSGSKYGFRTTREGIGVNLIRGSYEPDPLPDYGVSHFDLAIGVARDETDYDRAAALYSHPRAELSAQRGQGTLPESASLLELRGARLSALKESENRRGYILRLYDCEKEVSLKLPFDIARAGFCDLNERLVEDIVTEQDRITLNNPGPLVTVYVEKEKEQ